MPLAIRQACLVMLNSTLEHVLLLPMHGSFRNWPLNILQHAGQAFAPVGLPAGAQATHNRS